MRASTLLSGPLGSRALYDVLVRLGIPVERRRTPLFDLGKSDARRAATAVLVVLDPPQELLAAELAQVVRLVRAGRAVVAAGAGGGITRCVGWSTSQGRRFFPADTFAVVSPKGLELPPVADFLQPLTDLEARRRVRGGPSEQDECETLPPPVADTLLRLADGRPAALRLRYGAGSVTLVADVGYFRNRAWRARMSSGTHLSCQRTRYLFSGRLWNHCRRTDGAVWRWLCPAVSDVLGHLASPQYDPNGKVQLEEDSYS